MINLPQGSMQQAMNTGPTMSAGLAPGALRVGSSSPFASAVGGSDLSSLVDALRKSKTQKLLAGQLPGVAPPQALANALAQGPPAPLSLGGIPQPQPPGQ